MTVTRLCLGNPVAVKVAVILVLIFGLLSLFRLPIQLIPEVDEPEITITTNWRAAAPNEVEAEIIEPQEDVLRGLPGMTELTATASEGRGEINITFAVGVDMRRALIEVLNRINQVSEYPIDADEPVISTVGADARAIAWFIIKTDKNNDRDIASYQDYVREVVQTRFERIPGVARSEIYGGREREIRITYDPYKVASLGIQLPEVFKIAGTSKDVSAGFADVGKREYSMRYTGKYSTEDLNDLIITWRDGFPVYLRDVARVEERLVDKNSFVLTRGTASIAINAQREIGVNVLEVMHGLKQAMAELQDGPLPRAGLTIEQVYDETVYIDNSIEMLRNNLGMGILLAVAVLLVFLLRLRITLIVALSIPICLIAGFSLMEATGRTLNVVSLAGLALAVGMVLDASIIVLENIVRLRQEGKSADEAAEQGVSDVWGALLASTATTVAIFLPVIFLKEESGQIFSDLAIVITAAIILSFIVAVTVVPTAARYTLSNTKIRDPFARLWTGMSRVIMFLTNGFFRRSFWIVILISLPLYLGWSFLPKADYLPEGNRNLVIAFVLPPPGLNIEHMEQELGQVIAERMHPYMTGEKQPEILHYFFVAFSRGVFMGARAIDPDDADQLITMVNSVIQGLPDVLAFAKRAPLFGGFDSSGRTIEMQVQGRDLEIIMDAALNAFIRIPQVMPGARVQPKPGLELSQPELQFQPDERRIAEAGWNRSTLSGIIRTFGDGLFVGDYFDGEQTLDIILRAEPWETPEELEGIPLATPDAEILPLGELVKIKRTAGPDTIRRLDRRRTVTLEITPPENVSLEDALQVLKNEVEPEIRLLLPEDGDIRYGGTADKLQSALKSLTGSFWLALVILYLLMSAMFRSFKDSLLVLLAIPLATVGGVFALVLLNKFTFQSLDLLTMIGFIILLGLVVNNAILLVHQARQGERNGLGRKEAVNQAIQFRLRPIFMGTLTSIFGMLPLMLVPGAGTELYRGLACVIVGGMAISTVFTLLLLPSLLRIGETAERFASGKQES